MHRTTKFHRTNYERIYKVTVRRNEFYCQFQTNEFPEKYFKDKEKIVEEDQNELNWSSIN